MPRRATECHERKGQVAHYYSGGVLYRFTVTAMFDLNMATPVCYILFPTFQKYSY